jgi:hypothetical protein
MARPEREVQVEGSKPSIRRRNSLWKRRDVVLRAIRELHEGKLASEVQRVARDTADSIIADYWKRDADGAPLNKKLIKAAIRVRDKLQAAEANFAQLAREHAQLDLEALKARADLSSAHRPSVGTDVDAVSRERAWHEEWFPRLKDLKSRAVNARAEVDRLSANLMRAAKAARCSPFANELDAMLMHGGSGQRVNATEDWDVAVQIWKRFGKFVQQDGVYDERVALHERDDAIAITLFCRAILSPEASDDLLAVALRAQQDAKLRKRTPTSGFLRGWTTYELARSMIWLSLDGHRLCDSPMSEEEMRRRTSLDDDPRLARFIAAAEVAYEAVTGEEIRVPVLRDDAQEPSDSAKGAKPAGKRKDHRKRGRKQEFDPEDDRGHFEKRRRLKLSMQEYIDGKHLWKDATVVDMERLEARVRDRRRRDPAK